MISAAELKPRMAIRLEGQIFKVISAEFKAGAGQLGGVVKTKLRNLASGHILEPHFRPDERMEDLELERRTMQFLFGDAEISTFMNVDTYEQVEIPHAVMGAGARFLEPEITLSVEFFDGRPVNVEFPTALPARIADTAPAVHSQQDNVWKEATLENGAVILVPLFIDKGETIHVDVESGRYLDRVRAVRKRGA